MTKLEDGGIGTLAFPLLSDLTKNISKAYNCLITEGQDAGVSLRATYIIDPKGILCHYSQNQLSVGRSVDEIFRLVEACQFHAEFGDVCPANWKKGAPTMKASHDEDKTQDYFK